jgi:hypothetical protein
VAGKLEPSASVTFLPTTKFGEPGPQVFWNCSETTDVNGRYTFDRLLPGRGDLGHPMDLFDEKGTLGMNSTGGVSIRLESGKTAHVDLGSGRPVIGQLRWATGAKRTAPWNHVLIMVQCQRSLVPDLNPRFSATLDAQGNFSIDSVPAGDYELSVRVSEIREMVLRHRFSVPAIDKKLSQRPVDLGLLTLKAE